MTLSAQSSRFIETRLFVVIMVFSIVSGVETAFMPYLSILFSDTFGWSAVEFGYFSILLSSLQYLFSPILFFIVLYVTCGGPLLNRVASVLMSLVFGSLVGYPIGGFIGAVFVAVQLQQAAALFYPISYLAQHVVGQTLMGFAVLAFSDINMRWRSAVSIGELQKSRPGGVTLLAALYVVFALLNTIVLPILGLYPSFVGVSPRSAILVVVTLGVVFVMVIGGQLVVAAGLYYGKKWGWITAVISSASSLVIDTYALVVLPVVGSFLGMLIPILLGAFFGLILSLAVLLYLLSINVRKFFGFVNPSGQVQDKSDSTLG